VAELVSVQYKFIIFILACKYYAIMSMRRWGINYSMAELAMQKK